MYLFINFDKNTKKTQKLTLISGLQLGPMSYLLLVATLATT